MNQHSFHPTFEQCSKGEVFKDDHRVVICMVHPQWGGYVGCCTVGFDVVTNSAGGHDDPADHGCFDVMNWHDGEFCVDPANPDGREPTFRHYCSAQQLVRFGVQILEAQAAHQKGSNGEPVRFSEHDRNELFDLAERLRQMIGAAP
jgi:hypothetical protein